MTLETTHTNILEILYQDPDLVAVNKPPGLLVHRSPVDRREKRAALQLVRNQTGHRVYPIHRLDRPTSGVLLFARSPDMARRMSELFQSRSIRKKYLAVVRGYVPESGRIDHPVKAVKDRYLTPIDQTFQARYPAVTEYRRLAAIELPFPVDRYPAVRYSLAALYPLTGRRHQLRYHMKHLSHPIIGDTRYGHTVHNHFFREQYQCRQLLLCARELIFPHPETGEMVRITAPLALPFYQVLKAFQWNHVIQPDATP